MESQANSYVYSPPVHTDRQIGLFLIAFGCFPFAVGSLLAASGDASSIPEVCVFRHFTGLPCPLCGATRAFIRITSGDPKFLSYNAFWVFAALAVILAGVLTMTTRISFQGFWRRRALPTMLVISLLAGGWVWALLNQGTIVH